MEKECKWYFEKHSGIEIGNNDPLISQFKAKKGNYYSLVREAIQNAMDAGIDGQEVCVKFSYKRLHKEDFPALFSMGGRTGEQLTNIRKFNLHLKDELLCLVVSDSNTTGMQYDQVGPCSFNSFTISQGTTSKPNSGSGGSYGYGKGAYYNISGIRSILVSTRFRINNLSSVAFLGVSRSVTHTYEDSKWSSLLYYGNGVNPITEKSDIPDIFLCNEVGTAIWILGVPDEIPVSLAEMRKSVLGACRA